MSNEGLYKKAISSQAKWFDIRVKELLRNSPKNIKHLREYSLAKLK